MIAVGQFVAWESPNSGVTYKGRVQERREIDGAVTLRIKVAGTYEIEGDAIVPEAACRTLVKKKASS
jgi:ribosomal protein L35AE/L33A